MGRRVFLCTSVYSVNEGSDIRESRRISRVFGEGPRRRTRDCEHAVSRSERRNRRHRKRLMAGSQSS